ncbi:hypothetical protein WJX73_003275 [Symbiochloris irregularis]|uniref:Amino acid transporter transmembrane domain-containing protein n=1 Tax=Symbiochloris irregularis TaxID=706552 RepID=A0AAW1PS90_9CHLO
MSEVSMKHLIDIDLDALKGIEQDPKLQRDAKYSLEQLDDPHGGGPEKGAQPGDRWAQHSGSVTSKAVHATKAALTEGHTWWDAILSNACTTVGQVILTEPYQFARTGIIAATCLYLGANLLSFYTMWLLVVLFLHRKMLMIKEGTWFTTRDEHGYLKRGKTTQFFDIVEFSMGRPWAFLAQACVVVQLLNSNAVQIIASASSQYELTPYYNKRTWSLVLGPVILIFGYLPSFRSSRLLNVIGLAGTQYSTLYFTISAIIKGYTPGAFSRPASSKVQFFSGAASVGNGQSHGVALEMMDAMRQSRKYTMAYGISWLWIIILMVPHSLAISLCYNKEVLQQSNVYAILPNNGWRSFSVYIMLIHNIAAFTLHVLPLMFLWERMLGVHEKSNWVRLPLRTFPLMLIWALAILFPFYGNVSSTYTSVTGFFVSHIFPGIGFWWFYRTKERRAECPVRIPRIFAAYNWAPIFGLNLFIAVFYAVGYAGFGTYYSWVLFLRDIRKFKIAAACFRAPPAYMSGLTLVC